MIGLMIGMLVFLFVLGFQIYKFVAINSIKLAAFAMDFILLIFYTLYYFHPYIVSKIPQGNGKYIWDILVALCVASVYLFLILQLNSHLPNISKAINLIIVFIGMSAALPLAIDCLSYVGSLLSSSIHHTTQIIFSASTIANKIITYAIILILSIPVWFKRMSILDNATF